MGQYRWLHWTDRLPLPISIPDRPGFRGLVMLGWLISADDLASHAWGVWTPLDGVVWSEWIFPVLVELRALLS